MARAKKEEKFPLTEDGERHPVADLEPVLIPGQLALPGTGLNEEDRNDVQPSAGVSYHHATGS